MFPIGECRVWGAHLVWDQCLWGLLLCWGAALPCQDTGEFARVTSEACVYVCVCLCPVHAIIVLPLLLRFVGHLYLACRFVLPVNYISSKYQLRHINVRVLGNYVYVFSDKKLYASLALVWHFVFSPSCLYTWVTVNIVCWAWKKSPGCWSSTRKVLQAGAAREGSNDSRRVPRKRVLLGGGWGRKRGLAKANRGGEGEMIEELFGRGWEQGSPSWGGNMNKGME